MSISVEEIAPPSGDAWRAEVGDKTAGLITYAGKSRRVSEYSGKTEETLRIDIETDSGDAVTIWATINTDVDGDGYPKRIAKAIAAGVRESGASSLEIGGRLGVERIADHPTERGAANDYRAQYKPPAASPGAAVPVGEPDTAAVADLLG